MKSHLIFMSLYRLGKICCDDAFKYKKKYLKKNISSIHQGIY